MLDVLLGFVAGLLVGIVAMVSVLLYLTVDLARFLKSMPPQTQSLDTALTRLQAAMRPTSTPSRPNPSL